MSEVVWAALITGGLSLIGVLVTLASRWAGAEKVERLEAELAKAQTEIAELHGESERYKAAYLGLLELTHGLLERVS